MGLIIISFTTAPLMTAEILKYSLLGIPLVTTFGALMGLVGKCGLNLLQEMTDKRTRKEFVLVVLLLKAFLYVFIFIAVRLGSDGNEVNKFLLGSTRIFISAEIAEFISQYFVDSNVYQWMMDKFRGRVPILRNIFAITLVNAVNAPIIAYLGMYGTLPDETIRLLAFTKPLADLPFVVVSSFGVGMIIYKKKFGLCKKG